MKNNLLITFLFISILNMALAQKPPLHDKCEHSQAIEKIKAAKIGVITQDLKLSPEQASKFWPIYNQYSQERGLTHKQIRSLTRNLENLSPNEALTKQDEILDLKQKEIDLTKQYREKFLGVITVQQYSKLLETEHRFHETLLKTLKNRKH